MKIPFSPPDITNEEILEVTDTLKSGWITTGPKTKLFEKQIAEFCGTSTAVCLNSATACAELALHILGIGEGDEVITSAYTYTASASVIYHVGATPILVDIAKDSFEMDYDDLEAKITPKTKAIIPVDLGGVICDYDRIFEIVNRKKSLFKPSNEIQSKIGRIAVVADGAHSLGAVKNGKRAGSFGDFTSFSFHAVKNLTTAEGGAVVWKDIEGINNEDIYKQFMLLSLHGQTKDALSKNGLGAWEYDIVEPYFKCNMTDIMAAIGIAQLRRYPNMLKRRLELVKAYNEAFKDLPVSLLHHYGDDFTSSCHLYLVNVKGKTREECNDIIVKMAEMGIATNVHYKPLPLLTAYKKRGFDIKDYPQAYARFENVITLPLYSTMTDEAIDYVIDSFKKAIS
ncbi:MAG: DegT/DnrJ/EryC1/StrS aminotransferase family protein [Clostridia bacterium]|nr:DegT/DnrJ/EryC1/StrS aminotransferase family protein [Clostridia bacterium]